MVRRLGISREALGTLRRSRASSESSNAGVAPLYRPAHRAIDVAGRVVILVDDGLATGVTAIAAVRVLRARGARAVILAVPVCPSSVNERLGSEFDEIVCLSSPRVFHGVGAAYEDFTQTSDRQVIELLTRARGAPMPDDRDPSPDGDGVAEFEITVSDAGVRLPGTLRLPERAHGPRDLRPRQRLAPGSSPKPRRRLALERRRPRQPCCSTSSPSAEAARPRQCLRHRPPGRPAASWRHAGWAARAPDVQDLPVGLFGASTGAAAALRAAALAPETVAVVVSRGGRPDLAGPALGRVKAPTLFVVGGEDREVLALNRRAAASLAAPHEIVVIPGAGHLFDEPGALDQVARFAARWFEARLVAGDRPGRRLGASAGDPA